MERKKVAQKHRHGQQQHFCPFIAFVLSLFSLLCLLCAFAAKLAPSHVPNNSCGFLPGNGEEGLVY
jgi:hypothetical protein